MRRPGTVALWLAAAALCCASFVLWRHGFTFLSPDESANAFFARTFAETGRLFVEEPLNAELGDALYPRSVISLGARVVPVGFFGVPLVFGAVAAAFGPWAMAAVTPLLAALTVLAWAAVCGRLFGERIGWLSGMLFAVHPALWYYASRSFMPNVPFLAFLTFAAFFLVARPFADGRAGRWMEKVVGARKELLPLLDAACAGLCFGAALLIRPAEGLWAGAAMAAVLWWTRAKGRAMWRMPAAFAVACLVALAPWPLLNRDLYGGALNTGYTPTATVSSDDNGRAGYAAPDDRDPTTMREADVKEAEPGWQEMSGREATEAASLRDRIETALEPVLPFGVHPRLAWGEFQMYGWGMFWWMFLLAAVGVPAFFRSQQGRAGARWRYAALAAGVSGWLWIMYGSWSFHDNPDPTQITIGNSHVRYWLPIFLLMTPLAAAGVDWALGHLRSARARAVLLGGLFAVLLALCVRTAWFMPQDGLRDALAALEQSAIARERVLARTEPDAVVIVDRADKILFPHRRVLYPLREERTYALMPLIAARAPLYYYGITFPPRDVAWLNAEKLPPLGLQIEAVETVGEETLYRIWEAASE